MSLLAVELSKATAVLLDRRLPLQLLKLSRPRVEAALFLIMFSVFFGIGSLGYDIGTINRMGPGFLPLVLSVIMAGLAGLVLLAPGSDEPSSDSGNGRPYWAVFGSIAVFAGTIDNFGLVPAVFLTTNVAMLGSKDFELYKAVLLSIVTSIFGAAIFIYGLGLPIPTFRSPF